MKFLLYATLLSAVGLRTENCCSRDGNSPQFSSSAWFPQSLMPLQCMSWGRHTVRLPQGKYPRGHEVLSSDVLSAVDKGKIKSIDLIKNAICLSTHLSRACTESPWTPHEKRGLCERPIFTPPLSIIMKRAYTNTYYITTHKHLGYFTSITSTHVSLTWL